jgi:hypothetical protein
MFVRPVVKRMFQQGTRLKVEEWVAQTEDMTRRLQKSGTATTTGQSALDVSQLATYIASLPAVS